MAKVRHHSSELIVGTAFTICECSSSVNNFSVTITTSTAAYSGQHFGMVQVAPTRSLYRMVIIGNITRSTQPGMLDDRYGIASRHRRHNPDVTAGTIRLSSDPN